MCCCFPFGWFTYSFSFYIILLMAYIWGLHFWSNKTTHYKDLFSGEQSVMKVSCRLQPSDSSSAVYRQWLVPPSSHITSIQAAKGKLDFSFYLLACHYVCGSPIFEYFLDMPRSVCQLMIDWAEMFCISHWWDAGQLEGCLLVWSSDWRHNHHIYCLY